MFQVKQYNKAKTFQRVINNTWIEQSIQFTTQINGGMGEFDLVLNRKDTNFTNGDIIEVYHKTTLIYVWFVGSVDYIITNYTQTRIVCYWLGSLLKQVLYNVSGDYEARITQEPATSFSNVVAFFNTFYNYFTANTNNLGKSTSYELSQTNCFDYLNIITKQADWFFWMVYNYVVYFNAIPATSTHTFTLEKDLVKIENYNETTQQINKYYLLISDGAGGETLKIYNESTSQAIYWIKEKYHQDLRVQLDATADEYANKIFSQYAYPVPRTILTINNTHPNYYTIKPWDTCKIRNSDLVIEDNLMIYRVSFGEDITTLELADSDNFISLIENL